MAQQWPSFPSEQASRLQQFVCAPTSRSPFYQQPMPTAWDGRALPSAHGRTTQSAFFFLGPTTQSAFLLLGLTTQSAFLLLGPTTQSAFLFLGPKMESSVLEGGGFGYAWHLSPTDCSLVRSEDWPLLPASPGPSFWKGNILGIKSLLASRAELQPYLFNRLAGTTEYVLYNNGVKDPQRYGWATDRGILEGSSDPWLSAPGLQQVGLRKSSSGFCWRPIYYNIGTCGINTTNWSITSPNKQG